MKQQVEQRVKAWKRFFTKDRSDLSDVSSWKDILLTLELSPLETKKLVFKASQKCGVFTSDERKWLYSLPYYKETREILQRYFVEDFANTSFVDFEQGYRVYFMRYPKVEEKQKNHLVLIEAVIVADKPVVMDFDVFTFLEQFFASKSVIIRYDNKVPKDWLVERQKYDAKQNVTSVETAADMP